MRILMRAQMEHDKPFPPHQVLLKNLMGGNIGNWLYQYSLYRTLMIDENTKIDIFNPSKQKVNDEYIDFVNENYDVFVLPLANAFKLSFIDEMKSLTNFIKELKIPCVVPGVGIQAKLGVNFNEKYEYLDESKAFIKAILKKSSIIGVRGEATGDFFKSLGFKEEKDYTIIGCPSLYTYGMHLPQVKELNYSQDSTLLFSSKVEHENKNVSAVLSSLVSQHENYLYAPQRLQDMLTCFYGRDYRVKSTKQPKERFFDKDKSVVFTSPYRWISFISNNIDFSIGTRLHGNVAAVLAGVPAFIMATDQRVTELASYHNIACVSIDTVNTETKLRDLIENNDFSKVHSGHGERFNHFVDFLEKNNLETVYSKDRNIEHVYFDDVIAGLDFSENVSCFGNVSTEEKLERVQTVAAFYADKALSAQDKLKAENEKHKNKLSALKAALADAESKKGLKGLFR